MSFDIIFPPAIIASSQGFARTAIIEAGLACPYLLNQILAFSARHLATCQPERQAEFLLQAKELQTHALTYFTTCSVVPDAENFLQVLFFSWLLATHFLSDVTLHETEANILHHFLQYLEVYRGVRTVTVQAWEFILQTELGHHLRGASSIDVDAQSGCGANHIAIVDSLISESLGMTELQKEACKDALLSLPLAADLSAEEPAEGDIHHCVQQSVPHSHSPFDFLSSLEIDSTYDYGHVVPNGSCLRLRDGELCLSHHSWCNNPFLVSLGHLELHTSGFEQYNYGHPTIRADGVALCNVTVTYTHSRQQDVLTVGTWLPFETWNGRTQSVGGGGWIAGRFFLSSQAMTGAVGEGYVTSTIDAGLHGEAGEALCLPDDWPWVFKQSIQEFDSTIGTSDAGLSEFRAAGGKMITYHGTVDGLIPFKQTVHYYNRALKLDPNAQDFHRFFEVPGLAHCAGGKGGQPTVTWDALVAWVENGDEPDSMPILFENPQGQSQDRILCPCPQRPSSPTSGSSLNQTCKAI
ncbi:hypothetical protein DL767_000710 [Monosporascus sp. MG133]|nr:hypothetical protein DL767_000710 [Monosporascus sp. MG133]